MKISCGIWREGSSWEDFGKHVGGCSTLREWSKDCLNFMKAEYVIFIIIIIIIITILLKMLFFGLLLFQGKSSGSVKTFYNSLACSFTHCWHYSRLYSRRPFFINRQSNIPSKHNSSILPLWDLKITFVYLLGSYCVFYLL